MGLWTLLSSFSEVFEVQPTIVYRNKVRLFDPNCRSGRHDRDLIDRSVTTLALLVATPVFSTVFFVSGS